jgi:FkbM family methyltransferase
MKRFLQIIQRKIEKFVGYRIINIADEREQLEHRLSQKHFFDLYFSKIDPQDFFFVQIGANDGVNNDPIHSYVTKYNLRGIAIEPQPDVFELLKATYKKYPRVECIHTAVATDSGTKPFYSMKESYKTEKNFSLVTGLATFNKDVLRRTIKRKIPHDANPDDFIQETLIETKSLSTLLSERNIQKINLIQIDCEGYDYEIVKMIDFTKFSPDIINLESGHLSKKDRSDCEALFERHGYTWFRHGIDTCAYRA